MPIPQPWFRTPEDYEAIRHLVTDEPQLFDTFEEWLEAAKVYNDLAKKDDELFKWRKGRPPRVWLGASCRRILG
jgi:hypothetical protein